MDDRPIKEIRVTWDLALVIIGIFFGTIPLLVGVMCLRDDPHGGWAVAKTAWPISLVLFGGAFIGVAHRWRKLKQIPNQRYADRIRRRLIWGSILTLALFVVGIFLGMTAGINMNIGGVALGILGLPAITLLARSMSPTAAENAGTVNPGAFPVIPISKRK